jgi:hypothetical protein
VASIQPGETVKIECLDWTGGQIGNNDSADDVKNQAVFLTHELPQAPPYHLDIEAVRRRGACDDDTVYGWFIESFSQYCAIHDYLCIAVS